jgi:hypothetical protein
MKRRIRERKDIKGTEKMRKIEGRWKESGKHRKKVNT